jgi:predicted aminopeptidase
MKRPLFTCRILPILLLALLGPGCSIGYILHAGVGQIRVLRHTIPVQEALNDPSLDHEKKEHLILVAEIKDFGEKELGLKKTHNYQSVYIESNQPTIYNLSASPKDRLVRITWWFPIVGRMPYLGFFDLESAKKKRESLLKKDLDVMIGRVYAYSTLGWFKDPITMNLLEGSTVDLVETILHEMTHTTIYIKGKGEFNEGLANLIGKVGAVAFLQKTYGPSHVLSIESQRVLEDERLLSSFIDSILQRLEVLYDSPVTYNEKILQREKLFVEFLKEFDQLKDQLKTDRFIDFGKAGLNNAYLMAIGLYHRYFNRFEAVYKEHGCSIKETLRFFQDTAEEGGDVMMCLLASSNVHN